MRKKDAVPRNDSENETRERALATVALMRREDLALTAATTTFGIDPKTVRRYAGSALRRESRGGDYRATSHDRIPRTLYFITATGTITITVSDSRTASRIAEHMNAVRTYTRDGDSSDLATFRGEAFEAEDVTYRFVTDLATLDILADAGELAIENLYRTVQA
jgi:hypothetical protein